MEKQLKTINPVKKLASSDDFWAHFEHFWSTSEDFWNTSDDPWRLLMTSECSLLSCKLLLNLYWSTHVY
jgi:hypothetical protein